MSNQTFPLRSNEAEELRQLEAVIKASLNSFLEVGEALSKIRDGKLYRETHRTFEDYCREKWQMTVRRARQLMTAAEIGTAVPILTNERQVREIAKVEPEKRAEVIEKAKELTGGKVTAEAIKAAANPAPVAAPADPPAVSTPAAPELALQPTEQPGTWSLPKWGDRLRDMLTKLLECVPAESRAEAKWHAGKVCAEVFAPSDADPKPEPWGPRNVIPPLPEWVTTYSAHINYPMNGAAWCDQYQTKGWSVGKVKMKDWQSAVRNWKTNGWGLGNVALAQRKPDAPRKEYSL